MHRLIFPLLATTVNNSQSFGLITSPSLGIKVDTLAGTCSNERGAFGSKPDEFQASAATDYQMIKTNILGAKLKQRI